MSKHVSFQLIASVALAFVVNTASAIARPLLAPAGGQTRALVVGIDNYPHLRPLKGAVADANDLVDTLKRAGVSDLIRLVDREATRKSVVSAIEQLVARAKNGDLVLIAIAGHGTRVPERVKGSKPDGRDEAYLLYDFNPHLKTPDMIIGPEMKRWLSQLEARGIDVLFVVDSCFGGGMTRSWDPRSGDMTYRDAALDAAMAAATAANLAGVTALPADSFRDESTFKRVTFLAAVDKNTPSPEVHIPGHPTRRGALSYAVARAIDGISDGSRNGMVTRNALFSYARQTVLQFSNNRQLIVTEPISAPGSLDAVVWRTDAGTAASITQTGSEIEANPKPVRLAIVNGNSSDLDGSKPLFTPFTIVSDISNADLTWDARALEIIVAGDVVAQKIGPNEISAVVDRVWAISELAKVGATSPQPIEILPDNKRHYRGKNVIVRAARVRNKHAVIFNIAGNGEVQFLFPMTGDRLPFEQVDWSLPTYVKEPYGADTVIAVTSDQRLDELAAAIARLNGRLAAGLIPQQIAKLLQRDPSARVGFASLFTALAP